MLCTQEVDEDVDVIWDWNSPRLKHKYIRRQKKFDVSISPQLTIKKHSSSGQIPKFDKLKEEVAALRSQITQPNQERTPESNTFLDILQDDSLDEDLVLCTQIVEKELENNNLKNKTVIIVDEKVKDESIEKIFEMSTAMNNSIQKLCDNNIADDSLDCLLGRLEEPQIDDVKPGNSTGFSVKKHFPPKVSDYQSPFRKSKSFDETCRLGKCRCFL